MTWPTKKISECIEKIPKKSGIPVKKYQKTGKFPIIDQGQDFIGGYTDSSELVYFFDNPVVVFGDHTRAIKFIDFPFAVGADGTKVLSPKEFLDQKYFYLALTSLDITARGYARHFGILKEKEIPLPPLYEQKKIVARLEKQLAKVKEVKRLRAEALVLTQKLLSAELHKIFKEGKKKGWVEYALEDLSNKITDGTHHTPTYTETGIPFISVKNLTKGSLDFSNCKYISKKEHEDLIKRCHPEFEDVLLTKVGTTGIARVVDTKKDFSIFVSVALIKPKKKLVNPNYLTWILNAPNLRGRSAIDTEGVGNKNLVLRKIYKFPILVPPLSEQKKIVTRLDELQEKIKKLQEHQKSTAADLDRLEQSILHEAFEEKL